MEDDPSMSMSPRPGPIGWTLATVATAGADRYVVTVRRSDESGVRGVVVQRGSVLAGDASHWTGYWVEAAIHPDDVDFPWGSEAKWIVDATISTAFVLAAAADAVQVVRAAHDFAVSWNEGAGVRQAAEALVLAAGGNLPDLDVGVAIDRARARRDGDLRGMALSIYDSLRPEVEAYGESTAHGDGGST